MHSQQGLNAHRGWQPGIDLGGAVQAPAALQLQQLVLAQRRSEMGGRLRPAPSMQRLGVKQQPIQIKQAGSGRGEQSGSATLVHSSQTLRRVRRIDTGRGSSVGPLLTLSTEAPGPSAVTESNTTIESVLQEQRVFDPPAEVSAKARIGSLEAYRTLAEAARTDPDAFWGDAARRELHWFEPFHTVLDWSDAPRPLV